jgi:quercetin dioxygenase-like cupin family protein
VKTVDTKEMELMEGWFANDPTVHFRANFALWGGNGAEDLSAVYIELEPGKALGEHTDSPEELLIVLEGMVEFSIGAEHLRAGRGELAVVPAMAPHNIRNIGQVTARVIGVFPKPGVVANFVEPIQPINQGVMVFGEVPAAAAVS